MTGNALSHNQVERFYKLRTDNPPFMFIEETPNRNEINMPFVKVTLRTSVVKYGALGIFH